MPLNKPRVENTMLFAEMPPILTIFDHFDKSRSDFEQAFFGLRLKPTLDNMMRLNVLTDDMTLNFQECVAAIISGESDVDRQADQILSLINSENESRSKFINDNIFSCDNTCEIFETADDDLRELDTDIYTELIDNGSDPNIVSANIASKFADYVLDDVIHFSGHIHENIQLSPIHDIKSSVRAVGYYGLLATGIATTAVSLLQLIK